MKKCKITDLGPSAQASTLDSSPIHMDNITMQDYRKLYEILKEKDVDIIEYRGKEYRRGFLKKMTGDIDYRQFN